jgi:hypothetical protein
VLAAAIRGSLEIYVDSVQRAWYNREHPPDKETLEQIKEHEVDCVVGEDEEEEEEGLVGICGPMEMKPGMSPELEGIDDEITGIEE